MKGAKIAWSLCIALLFSTCALPSNTNIPPEVMVTGEVGSTSGTAIATKFPFSGSSPAQISQLSIPAGYSLWGSTYVDSHLIVLSHDTSGLGLFLVAPIPLATAASFVQINGFSGTPLAVALVTTQVLAVLESTPTYPKGCLELFDVNTLIQMTGNGTISPRTACQPIVAGSGTAISGGFLLPLADGVTFLAGLVSGGGTATTLYLMTQSSVLLGSALSIKSTWTLPTSYGAGVPLSGVALQEVVLLPDPGSPKVDLYSVTALYGSGGGALTPMSTASLQLSSPPTLLETDPSQSFLLTASTQTVSVFALSAILNPGKALTSLGTLGTLPGESFESVTTYAGSS